MGAIRQTGVKVALVSWDPLTMTNSHKKGESRNLDPKYYHRPHQHQDHHWYHFQTHGTPSQLPTVTGMFVFLYFCILEEK